jgi:hypothetical protein
MLKFAIFLCAAGGPLLVSGASSSIGFVNSPGEFRVDGSSISGNGTVFEGTLVETAAARSTIQLSGARIIMAPQSRLRVYRDRAVLEKGSGSLENAAHYRIDSGTLRIATSTPASIVQIDLIGLSALTVAARGGPAEVRNSSDVLTARVVPGMALSFDPQAVPAQAVKLTGIVQFHDGAYFLTDQTTQVTVQLLGTNVAKHVGKVVQVTGSSVTDQTPTGGATQVVRVIAINKVAAGGAAAAGSGGAGAAGAGTAGGLSTAVIFAIVGGVAVAAAVGGLAAAGTFSGTSVSRP